MNSAFATSAKVVILRSNPEDRHGFGVALAQATRQFHRRERFVDRVEWTSEQTRLLAGHDGEAVCSRSNWMLSSVPRPHPSAGSSPRARRRLRCDRLDAQARTSGTRCGSS